MTGGPDLPALGLHLWIMTGMVHDMNRPNLAGLTEEQAQDVVDQFDDFMDAQADDYLMREEG